MVEALLLLLLLMMMMMMMIMIIMVIIIIQGTTTCALLRYKGPITTCANGDANDPAHRHQQHCQSLHFTRYSTG